MPGDGTGPGASGGAGDDAAVRLTAWVEGRVQGVGFRWWVRCRALELGLTGTAGNLPDGRVKVIAEGSRHACRELLALLTGSTPPGRVSTVTQEWDQAHGDTRGFTEL
jgi:acylphosphatase